MAISTDIMTVGQLETLMQKLVNQDSILGFDQLHPAAFQHLFDAIRQGIRWGNEIEKLRSAETIIKST
jgi:hypothetical protein